MTLDHHLHQLDLSDDQVEAITALCDGSADPELYPSVRILIRSCYRHPSRLYQTLEACNEILDGHGIEALTGEDWGSSYFGDIQALYVNMGDSYLPTLIYDCQNKSWHVDCVGDFVERHPKRFPLSSSASNL